MRVLVTQTVNGKQASGTDLLTIPWTAVIPSGLAVQCQPGSANVIVTTTAHYVPWPDTMGVSAETATLSLVSRAVTPPVPRR